MHQKAKDKVENKLENGKNKYLRRFRCRAINHSRVSPADSRVITSPLAMWGKKKKKEISHEVERNEGGYERSHQKEYLKWDLQESERDSPLHGPFLLFSIFSSSSAFEGLTVWASSFAKHVSRAVFPERRRFPYWQVSAHDGGERVAHPHEHHASAALTLMGNPCHLYKYT